MKSISNSVLRESLRAQRLTISEQDRELAGQLLCQQVLTWLHTHYQHNTKQLNIGIYYPIKGEINTVPLIQALVQQEHAIYLPRIHPFIPNELLFLRYHSNTLLCNSRWNIPEPSLDIRQVLPFNQLNIVFVPLVGFDLMNNRLGMGGGFYDRMLQHYKFQQILPIGVAYPFQQVLKIEQQEWDIPLPIIITPEHIYFNNAI